jgi:hypothetical protein
MSLRLLAMFSALNSSLRQRSLWHQHWYQKGVQCPLVTSDRRNLHLEKTAFPSRALDLGILEKTWNWLFQKRSRILCCACGLAKAILYDSPLFSFTQRCTYIASLLFRLYRFGLAL